MRNYYLVFLLVCLGFSGIIEVHAQQGSAQVKASASTKPTRKESLIKFKRHELEAVEKEIKALRKLQQGEREAEKSKIRAEKQARLEELKLHNPVKYQQELARQFELQKKREQVRQEKIEDGLTKPKMTHAQWLAHIKKRNPRMYKLVIKRDRLLSELKYGNAPQAATASRSKLFITTHQ